MKLKVKFVSLNIIKVIYFPKAKRNSDNYQFGLIILYKVDKLIEERWEEYFNSAIPEDEIPEIRELINQKLPSIYRKYTDIFSKKDFDRLPPSRKYDYKIKLKEELSNTNTLIY